MEVKVSCLHCKQHNKFRGLTQNKVVCFHCRQEFKLPQIGDYYLIEQLGEGGFGIVYRGYEPALEREVAIKVLHPRDKQTEDDVLRFSKEAKLTARINHPHVAPIFAHGQQGERFFLVSALIKGKELKQYISKHGFPDIKQAVSYAITLLETLQDVHEKYQIWHRDVKPSNIMISEDGVIYLLDFGIASSQDPDVPKLTFSGYPLGTPQYMPPEQVQMKSPTDIGHWSDQYSMGVVLYQMLTGHTPFTSDNIPDVYRMIIQKQPPKPSLFRKDIDPALEEIILKALQKNPAKRYRNCREFATALRDWLSAADKPPMSDSFSFLPSPIRPSVRPSPTSGGMKILFGILIIALMGLGGYFLFKGQSGGTSSSGNPKSDKNNFQEEKYDPPPPEWIKNKPKS
jgi:eukaryotic-like serine/threonine-protein kinase